jgi:hypothetical protein
VAGRPKRPNIVDDQEVIYETVHWRLDKRIVAAVREINARSVPKGPKKPQIQETAGGLIYWGLRCAQYHRSSTEAPELPSQAEAEYNGFSLVEDGTPRLGEADRKTGRYRPDDDKLPPARLHRPRQRKPRQTPAPIKRIM